MKVRVCYQEIEEIYEVENFAEALEQFIDTHDDIEINTEKMTITEVDSFYDKNRKPARR